MSSRQEFVALALSGEVSVRELCRRFSISPTTAYKWIGRGTKSDETFEDRSRRPLSSPHRTTADVENRILAIRDGHPYWNARKIRRIFQREGLGPVPAASTVGQILKRHGRISAEATQAATPWIRFEHPSPNDLSQIDFKGHFQVGSRRCYLLTMLDDHSRYAQIVTPCADETTETVRRLLIDAFRKYGLPRAMNMDNGNPWGNPTGDPFTKLTVWLMRLGIIVSHSRPYHPQTNGKDERLHKTLDHELLNHVFFDSFEALGEALQIWVHTYNFERPHESLALEVPASRYRPSPRSFPEKLPAIEYGMNDLVCTVRGNGMLYAWKTDFYIGQAFAKEHVALRPSKDDGVWEVYFCNMLIAALDRRNGSVSVN